HRVRHAAGRPGARRRLGLPRRARHRGRRRTGALPGRDARHHAGRLLVLRRSPRLAAASPRLASRVASAAGARPAPRDGLERQAGGMIPGRRALLAGLAALAVGLRSGRPVAAQPVPAPPSRPKPPGAPAAPAPGPAAPAPRTAPAPAPDPRPGTPAPP